MVRAPGRVIYIPPLSGSETRHGLMPHEMPLVYTKEIKSVYIKMLSVYFEYE